MPASCHVTGNSFASRALSEQRNAVFNSKLVIMLADKSTIMASEIGVIPGAGKNSQEAGIE